MEWIALRELAINAAKYGALAGHRRKLSFVWSVGRGDAGEPQLQVAGSEVAGRLMMPPERRDPGSIVTEGAIAQVLRGKVGWRYRFEGLQVTLMMPLAQVAATPPVSEDKQRLIERKPPRR